MKIAVICARFQVASLHEGHKSLLKDAFNSSDLVLIFLGVPMVQGTQKDPLDYVTRAMSVSETVERLYDGAMTQNYPMNYLIFPIKDMESNSDWDKVLDTKIEETIKFEDRVLLLSGENGFLKYYNGRFKKNQKIVKYNHFAEAHLIIPSEGNPSGTVDRVKIADSSPKSSKEFREGIIYSTMNQRKIAISTVDAACWRKTATGYEVLVGKKEGEALWRFPGGFTDPFEAEDNSLLDAVRREFFEETKLTCESSPVYIGSHVIDDWRWNHVPDKKIMTTLFAIEYSHGYPVASDDLAEVKWIPATLNAIPLMNRGHKPLMGMFLRWLGQKEDIKDLLPMPGADNV